jgi:acyl carrier protein
VEADSAYLIAGETETAALRLVEWLAGAGARRLLVVMPREPSPTARQSIAELAAGGVQVDALTADLAEESGLSGAMTAVLAGGCPLGGVLFAAGGEPAATCPGFSPARDARVAWNLHRAVRESSARWFMLFSAASPLLGRKGSASQAAAAALLEAIAHEQQQMGKHAVTIHWGSWHCEASPAGGDPDGLCEGFMHFPATEALQLAGRLLQADGPPTAVVTSDSWQTTAAGNGRSVFSSSDEDMRIRAGNLEQGAGSRKDFLLPAARSALPASGGGNLGLVERLRSADPDSRGEVMLSHFIDMLVQVTNQERHRIDSGEPLSRFGLDSLMAVELSGAIERTMGISLPLEVLLEDPSIFDLAQRVLSMWARSEESQAVSGPAGAPSTLGRGPVAMQLSSP